LVERSAMSFHDGGTRDSGRRKERPPSLSLGSHEHQVVDDVDNPRPSVCSKPSFSDGLG
jgi:hypothetical protein